MHSSSPRPSRNRQFAPSDDFIYEDNYLVTLCRRHHNRQPIDSDSVDFEEEEDLNNDENVLGDNFDDTRTDFPARNGDKSDNDDSADGPTSIANFEGSGVSDPPLVRGRSIVNVRGRGRGASRGRKSSNGVGRGARSGRGRGGAANALPAVPEFNPLTHPAHLFRRKGQVTLPPALELGNVTPLLIFTQFFPAPVLETIVQNTNSYAATKLRHIRDSNPNITPRKWKQLTVTELKEWIAIVIYMGLHREPAVEDYWNKDPGLPVHPIADRMSLFRFQQIILPYFYNKISISAEFTVLQICR